MQQLQKDIEQQKWKSFYLLYGEESYLKRQYKHRLLDGIVADGDTMNLSRFEGKNLPVASVIELADTLPFFAEHRLILIENSGLFQKACPELTSYLPDTPDTTIFLFVEEEVDKRNKLFKFIKDHGRVTELTRQREETLERWVLGMLKRENKCISRSALQLFFSKTGLDMEIIHQELEKLLSYCMEKEELTSEDIEAVCTSQTPDQIFEMINAISSRQTKRALSLYYDLLLLKVPPLRILALFERQFQILLKLKDMQTRSYSSQTITQKAKLPAFAVRRNLQIANGFTMEQLKKILQTCAQTEEDIKTGQITDQLGVELLIVQYSR